jgi:hypothetical protein
MTRLPLASAVQQLRGDTKMTSDDRRNMAEKLFVEVVEHRAGALSECKKGNKQTHELSFLGIKHLA